jgi:NTE family protein
VGVLRGLVDAGFLPREHAGIDVFVGSSAGAINAGVLAAWADDFDTGLGRLQGVWNEIRPEQVFRTDLGSLGRIGARWAWDLSLGGALGRVRSKALLDTAPLGTLLRTHVDFARIEANIAAGAIQALALVATDLHSANGVIFLQAPPHTPGWSRRRWRIERTAIRAEHLMASSAIPIFFPYVRIGGHYYGDGSIRNTAPLSPAINLGAERVIAIGVSGPSPPEDERAPRRPPTIAQVTGVLLDAVMLDAIEVDVEHSERVNTSVLRCVPLGEQPFRMVDVLWLKPSVQVREIAAALSHRIPRVVRYLMRGLGSDESVTELVSYLLFDPEFTGRLIELGREDVVAERPRLERFFAGAR